MHRLAHRPESVGQVYTQGSKLVLEFVIGILHVRGCRLHGWSNEVQVLVQKVGIEVHPLKGWQCRHGEKR